MYNPNMKKVIPVILIAGIVHGARADENILFADNARNSIGMYVAQSTGDDTLFKLVDASQWEISPQTLVIAKYSQPTKIFRLDARMNLEFVQNIAYHSSHGLSFFAAGISWDVALLKWRGFYLGIGIGPYMRDSRDRWVDSRLVFGERVFIGKKICDKWRGEIFTQHFSNGNFTDVNRGFNFVGLGISYSF